MLTNAAIMAGVVLVGALLASRHIAGSETWRATVTPLASIIGSGFLVLGPILQSAYGSWAPAVMAVLCAAAWLFGAAVRRNIRTLGDRKRDRRPRTERGLDHIASWALAFAYIISVAYYLNLFGAFAVSLTEVDDRLHARLVATAAFLLILAVGWTRGFKALEDTEQVFVGIKLAVIAGLLAGLGVFTGADIVSGGVVWMPARLDGWAAATLAFGLIVTVQGFETSRYLGDSYKAAARIRTMRLAQGISTGIYMVYVVLLTVSFSGHAMPLGETAIVDMMGVVAPVLPVLLVAAALSAQLSAAVADTGGSGGLFVELSGHRIPLRLAYLGLVAAGLALTWAANLFEIIAYASRAFAAYYALQSAIAVLSARRDGRRFAMAGYAALTVLGLAITAFGTPIEG